MLVKDLIERTAMEMKVDEVRFIKTARGCLRLYKFQFPFLCRSKRLREKARKAALSYPGRVIEIDANNCIYVQIRLVDCKTYLPVL